MSMFSPEQDFFFLAEQHSDIFLHVLLKSAGQDIYLLLKIWRQKNKKKYAHPLKFKCMLPECPIYRCLNTT
jgi:hypothetical protein